nr:MAG TPA: hypothetical protein [Caudoviricetes sp.]
MRRFETIHLYFNQWFQKKQDAKKKIEHSR